MSLIALSVHIGLRSSFSVPHKIGLSNVRSAGDRRLRRSFLCLAWAAVATPPVEALHATRARLQAVILVDKSPCLTVVLSCSYLIGIL